MDDNDGLTFLVNPFGLAYTEVYTSNLVKIGLQGNMRRTVDQPDWPINPAGFTVHAAIHAGISGAHCIVYIRTTTDMAVTCTHDGLPISDFCAAQLHSKIACRGFEGITVHADEGPHLVRNIGGKPAVILRNHGLLARGDSIAWVFAVLWPLNRACKIQLASTSMGPVSEIPEAIACDCTRDSLQFNPNFGVGEDVFAALTRTIGRIGSSYRT